MWLVLAAAAGRGCPLSSQQMALYLSSGGCRVGRGQSLQRLLSMVAGSSGKSTTGGRISHQVNFSRRLSIGNIARQWKNETPPGSLTEIYVYAPDQDPRVWPDPVLGVFAPKDPRCCLPGNLGLDLELQSSATAAPTVFPSVPSPPQTDEERARVEQETAKDRLDKSDLLTSFTRRERQAQALYSANDYLQNTADAEATACQDILEVFPRVEGAAKFHCKLQEAPQLLRSDLGTLFPGRDLRSGNLSVITLAQRTLNDMTGWSEAWRRSGKNWWKYSCRWPRMSAQTYGVKVTGPILLTPRVENLTTPNTPIQHSSRRTNGIDFWDSQLKIWGVAK